jgi:putative transposase
MTTTFVAALRHDEITAPCVFDGPISRSGRAARRFVVLDNLASHKVKGVRQLIEEAGALRYLPAYSPDLNPIEQAYGKLKAELRKAAARTFDALVEAIAQALNELCANYLANSGYRRQS